VQQFLIKSNAKKCGIGYTHVLIFVTATVA